MAFYWLLVALAALDAENSGSLTASPLPGISWGLSLLVILASLDNSYVATISGSWVSQAAVVDLSRHPRRRRPDPPHPLALQAHPPPRRHRPRRRQAHGPARRLARPARRPARLCHRRRPRRSFALVLLTIPSARTNPQSWATSKLPLAHFSVLVESSAACGASPSSPPISAGPASSPSCRYFARRGLRILNLRILQRLLRFLRVLAARVVLNHLLVIRPRIRKISQVPRRSPPTPSKPPAHPAPAPAPTGTATAPPSSSCCPGNTCPR